MFVITEWESLENRKISDGRGMGFSDMCCWAHIILKLSGAKMPPTWKQWVKENPEMTIVSVEDKQTQTLRAGHLPKATSRNVGVSRMVAAANSL